MQTLYNRNGTRPVSAHKGDGMFWPLMMLLGPAYLGLTLFKCCKGVQNLGAYSYSRATTPLSFFLALALNLLLGITITGAISYGFYDTYFAHHAG